MLPVATLMDRSIGGAAVCLPLSCSLYVYHILLSVWARLSIFTIVSRSSLVTTSIDSTIWSSVFYIHQLFNLVFLIFSFSVKKGKTQSIKYCNEKSAQGITGAAELHQYPDRGSASEGGSSSGSDKMGRPGMHRKPSKHHETQNVKFVFFSEFTLQSLNLNQCLRN